MISIINVNNPQCFKKLIALLDAYDKNPQAYEKGQRFEMSDTVHTMLNIANFLFSLDENEGVTNKNLCFFNVLLSSISYAFDSSLLKKNILANGEKNVFWFKKRFTQLFSLAYYH